MSERRAIRVDGVEEGDLTLDQLMRSIERGDFDGPVEFQSIKTGKWLPVAGIMNDFAEHDALADMRSAGITKVFILGAGDECPACRAISGRVISITEVPSIPPPECSCVPWCRCIVTAQG